MATARTYVKTSVIALAGLIALTVLLNRLVDPFWYYRDISIKGFNAVKTQFQNYERHIKPVVLREIRPEAVVFSSSVLEAGLRPSHPALALDGRYRSYNFGMKAAWWDMVFCNVIYAIDRTDLRTAVIGLSPEPMPMADCSDKLAGMDNLQQRALLLSFDALKASVKTIAQQNKHPSHTLDGMLYYHRFEGDRVEQTFFNSFYQYMLRHKEEVCKAPGYSDIPAWTNPDKSQDMSGLKFLLKKLVDRKVEVKLVMYPFHALWTEMTMCEGVLVRWHSIYDIAKAVEEVTKGADRVELWDFQGYSHYITEKIVNNQTKYWQDFGHFNYEMGDVMLDRLYHRDGIERNADDDEFGVVLTSEIIPRRFRDFFYKRKAFTAKNPWFVEDFVKFKAH